MTNTKINDPRYLPGVSEVDDDMSDAEWLEAYGVPTHTWQSIAKLSDEDLETIQDSDEYDEKTQELAHEELEERRQAEYESSEMQAAYDDEW